LPDCPILTSERTSDTTEEEDPFKLTSIPVDLISFVSLANCIDISVESPCHVKPFQLIGPVPLHNLRVLPESAVSKKKQGRFKDAFISLTIAVDSARPTLTLLDDRTAFPSVFEILPLAPFAFVVEEEREAFARVLVVFPTSPFSEEEERDAFARVRLKSPTGIDKAISVAGASVLESVPEAPSAFVAADTTVAFARVRSTDPLG
jgi:hypothetical protein